jgi:hypothetical protein
MTYLERENPDGNHKLSLLRCGSCNMAWLSRAGRLLPENDDHCIRCGGPLEAND